MNLHVFLQRLRFFLSKKFKQDHVLKAVVFNKHGIPSEVCQYVDIDDPGKPKSNEITVQMCVSAINPADLLAIEGRYPSPPLPTIPGVEGVGIVREIGSKISNLSRGDKVLVLSRHNWVEYQNIAADQAIKLPCDIDLQQAAQMKANPPTAIMLLENYEKLNPGDWVIQNAANSAVGIHLIRLARLRGIRTVNIVRRAEVFEEIKSVGGDLVFLDTEELAKKVRNELGDEQLKLAIDAIGGESTMSIASCLSTGGTVVNYGYLAGKPCMITQDQTIVKQIKLVGFWARYGFFDQPHHFIQKRFDDISNLFLDGTLFSKVDTIYRLDQFKQALKHAGSAARHGKILLSITRD